MIRTGTIYTVHIIPVQSRDTNVSRDASPFLHVPGASGTVVAYQAAPCRTVVLGLLALPDLAHEQRVGLLPER